MFLSGLTLDPDAGTGALNNDQVHYSNGSYDGTRQSCHTLFDDGTYRRSGLVNNRIMYFFEKVTGTTPVLKVEAKYIGYDTVNQELVFQMLKTSSNYQANIRAF